MGQESLQDIFARMQVRGTLPREGNTTELERSLTSEESARQQAEYEAEREAFEEKRKKAERDRSVAEGIKGAYIPARFIKACRKDFDPVIFEKAEKFIAGEEQGLYLHGPAGTGKTHLASAILQEAIAAAVDRRQPFRGMFETAPGILAEIRSTFRDKADRSESEVVSVYADRPILVIDDLGAEKLSEFVVQAFYLIIDRRYSELMPTIITSNCTLAEIADRLGERIASRIAGMCRIVEIKGKDRRLSR